jgi:hypothetical protein
VGEGVRAWGQFTFVNVNDPPTCFQNAEIVILGEECKSSALLRAAKRVRAVL